MVDQIQVDAHIESGNPELGMSKPVLVRGSNGKRYLMKNDVVMRNGNKDVQDASLFQELFCGLLANEINVDIPGFAIIEIDKDFIENNHSLQFKGRFKAGLYFGTEFIEDLENHIVDNYIDAIQNGQTRVKKSWNRMIRGISNKNMTSNIIAFDLLIMNFDRFGNEGNLIFSENNGNRKMMAIDHGHAFAGPYYARDELNKMQALRSNMDLENNQMRRSRFCKDMIEVFINNSARGKFELLGPVFTGLQQNVNFEDDENPFLEVVEKIENISDAVIDSIFEQIPSVWVSKGYAQLLEYKNFLNRQKYLVRYIIEEMVEQGAFTNFRGGELKWKEQERLFDTQ